MIQITEEKMKAQQDRIKHLEQCITKALEAYNNGDHKGILNALNAINTAGSGTDNQRTSPK